MKVTRNVLVICIIILNILSSCLWRGPAGKAFAQTNRIWATYYGGTGIEEGNNVTTDAAGNVYLIGQTTSSVSIASSGFQNSYKGGYSDAFLVKFNASGNRLWATYYGGSGNDIGYDVAVDISGNVYLSGQTNSTSGIASGGFQNSYGGDVFGYGDAFLVKFDAGGTRLWGTYYGGPGDEYREISVATDIAGNVYLSGFTTSTVNIASGGFKNNFGGVTDAFLVKFNAAGNRLWATYYGGTGEDYGYSIATDVSGNVYLAGNTNTTSGIASGGFQNVYVGALVGIYDAFLVKFDAAGNRLWATYYGGVENEYGNGVATDPSGNVYLAGLTESSSGIAFGGFQNTYAGDIPQGTYGDAFLVKFDANGSRLWATYYGSTGNEECFDVTTDAEGNVFLVADSYGDNGIGYGGYQNNLTITENPFVVKFDGDGNRLCATYYGQGPAGYDDERGHVAADGFGNVYLSGYTSSAIGIASGGFQNTFGGGVDIFGDPAKDAFLVKFISCTSLFTTSVTSANISCNGQCTGTATGMPSGGAMPYTYMWSNGKTTQTVTGLCAGTYTVTITDNINSSITHTISITQLSVLSTTITVTEPVCNGSLGSTTVTASGGTFPYIYQWSNGSSQFAITNLQVGHYTLTITDNNGCVTTKTLSIVEPPQLTVAFSTTNVLCNGASSGIITATASGGSMINYSYRWNNGNSGRQISGLQYGIYTVTVTDNNGCIATATTSITQPSPLTTTLTATDILCNGGNNGMLTVATSGGAAPYSYQWSNNQTGGTTTGLSAGSFTVIITDSNSCVQQQTVTVAQPSVLSGSLTATQMSCNGGTGSITISVNGGTGPYTYLWSNTQTAATANGLVAGSYTVIVSDFNGCTKIATATVTSVTGPTASILSYTDVACFGDNSAFATASATVGTPPYTYWWSNSQTNETATGLSAGTYTVIVTDLNGCVSQQTVTIVQPLSSITASLTSTPDTCSNGNGTATAIVSGGTSPYSYNWNNGETNATITSLSSATYSVIIVDGHGCSSVQEIVVGATGSTSAYAGLDATIVHGGSVQLSASGGVSYSWSPAEGLGCITCFNPMASPDETTAYIVFVTDLSGCTDTDTVVVTVEQNCGEIFVPNIFSPNDDDQNDFECVFGGCIQSIDFVIFNRWGEKVFETTDPNVCWDGMFEGQPLNTAVFIYSLKAVLLNEEQSIKGGSILLIR